MHAEQKRSVALALCEHLNNLIAGKAAIISRLAQPYAGDVLAVESEFQGYVAQTLFVEFNHQFDSLSLSLSLSLSRLLHCCVTC